ncbi:MAG TPA: iron-containing alcohol dehydrogenase [Tepidisphaeraceae bacterium]|nr:iron-containing alcohol dehydrogenase [Tepidisphaeraceae bacterium]
MNAFESFGVGRVIFGRGVITKLPDVLAALGRRAIVIYNGEGLGERVAALAESAGVVCVVRRQRGEPTVADVDAHVAEARKAECDCAIGAGGGSAIDAAKAVAGLLTNGGAVTDYMEVVGRGQKITRPAAPWVAIPTTAGTGAEATRNAVIGLPAKRFKASVRSELLLPRVAIIDPELGVSVPPAVTAASGMDAVCQLIESYTSTGANPVTDALALRGLAMATPALSRAYADGGDLEAREAMAVAAYLSGVTLTSAGLGAVHGFAAPLGANFPVPHGVVCAALLPHVIAANVAAARAENLSQTVRRYDEVARAMDVPDVAAHCAAWARELAIPAFKAFGLTDAHVPEVVALARTASSMKFNPVVLSDDALATVLKRAIRGE